MNPTLPSEFQCPTCQQSHHVFDTEKTEMYVCGNCNAVIRPGDNAIHTDYALYNIKGTAMLRLGSRGVLKGVNYTIIGIAERNEASTEYYWFEYTLMRDGDHELIFLSSYDGHWNLLKALPSGTLPELAASPNQENVTWESQDFKLFSRYRARYNYACGEFHWFENLRNGVNCVELICPPRILAVEINQDEAEPAIFCGEYILPEEISQAFLKGDPLPKPVGIASTQPQKLKIDPNRFLTGTLIFCILVLIIQSVYVYGRKEFPVFNESLHTDTSNTNKPLITPSFKLEGSTSNMEVILQTDVDNSWCEVDVTLVNEQTGKETAFVVAAEYYSGVSGGESWNEGSRTQKEFVCSVQPGTYHFVTTFNKDTYVRTVELVLSVWWDVPTWWNAIIVSLVMIIVAVVILFIHRSFEAQRWANSNVIQHNNE